MNIKYHAQDLARQVIKDCGLDDGDRVDVRALVQQLDLSAPIEINECSIVSDGALRQRDNCYQIDVKAAAPLNRQRFTIAHELGHILLEEIPSGEGKRVIGDKIVDQGKTEFFCNEFAAALLIPSELIHDLQSWEAISLERIGARSDQMRVGIQPLTKRVVQEAPGEGGYMVYNIEDQRKASDEFVLESGQFPTEYRARRNKPNLEIRIREESALYPYFHKAARGDDEYFFTNVSLNLTPFTGKQSTQTAIMAKAFGSRIYTIVVPKNVPIETFNHENCIKIGGLERESLRKFQ